MMGNDSVKIQSDQVDIGESGANDLERANGELASARRILDGIGAAFLFVKTRYLEANWDKGGGLILIGIRKNPPEIVKLSALVNNNSEFIEAAPLEISPAEFQFKIDEYMEHTPGASKFHEAVAMSEKLLHNLDLSFFQKFFDLVKSPGVESGSNGYSKDAVNGEISSALTGILSEILYRRIAVESSHEFLTQNEFEDITNALGIETEVDYAGGRPLKPLNLEGDVSLKGQLIIDPVGGTQVLDLEVGDPIYVDIKERTDTAVEIATALGICINGYWAPAMGYVAEITDKDEDMRRVKIKIAEGVTVLVPILKNLKVRTGLISREYIYDEPSKPSSATSPMPLLIGVILMAALIVVLLILK